MLSNFEPIGLFSKSNSLLRRASYCIGLGYHEDILPSVKADSRNFEMGSIISTKVLLIIYSVSGTGNQQFLISLFLDTYALFFVCHFTLLFHACNFIMLSKHFLLKSSSPHHYHMVPFLINIFRLL